MIGSLDTPLCGLLSEVIKDFCFGIFFLATFLPFLRKKGRNAAWKIQALQSHFSLFMRTKINKVKCDSPERDFYNASFFNHQLCNCVMSVPEDWWHFSEDWGQPWPAATTKKSSRYWPSVRVHSFGQSLLTEIPFLVLSWKHNIKTRSRLTSYLVKR